MRRIMREDRWGKWTAWGLENTLKQRQDNIWCVTKQRPTSAVRCVSDTEGNSSLLSLPLNIWSALLFSSLSGASALPGGRRSFSVRDLWSRHQVTGKLTVMLEDNSCLFESHSSSHESKDPAGNHFHKLYQSIHNQKSCCRLMLTVSPSALLSVSQSLLL